MCFSPTLSFASGAFLTLVGVVSLTANKNPNQKMFAALPVMFGVQQICEGFVWLHLSESATTSAWPTYFFLAFALVLWPAWVPISVLKMETHKTKRKILMLLSGLGIGVAMSAAWLLNTAGPEAYVVGHSIGYRFSTWHRVWASNFEFLYYFTPAQVPFFISSHIWVRRTGLLILGGMFAAMLIRHEAVTSVWCFFAALVSLYIAQQLDPGCRKKTY